MFKITNISANSLTLSDGRPLASHDSRELETVSDRDKSFADRGWLQIHEIETKPAKADPPKADPPKTPKEEVK